MSADWQAYVNDKRTVCKYGLKCYQKNPEHHANYKHPPPTKHNRKNKRFKPYDKKETLFTPKDEPKETLDTNTSSNADSFGATNTKQGDKSEEDNSPKAKIPKDLSFLKVDPDNKLFKELFLVDMPDDFFKFYNYLTDESSEKTLSSVNLHLIGPYDLLMEKLPKLDDKELYLTHWRYFYDPPEFQSVLKVKGKEVHFGYYRDDPKEKPVFVASNDSSKGCEITPVANNIFGAVYLYLTNEKHHSPFNAMACKQLAVKVKKWADDSNFSIQEFDVKKRKSKMVTKTFHGAGIVVPYNKKTEVGYRKLADSYANINKMFTSFKTAKTAAEKDKILSDLQPVITYANIAVDECDFGTGLEAGINLFCSGIKELEPSALSCLCSAYGLLDREAFAKIIQVHLKYRRKGPDMSVLNIDTSM